MGFDYTSRLGNVLSALKDNNTTTSAVDLSNGLSERVNSDNIVCIDPEITTPRADMLPAIYITISNKEEDYAAVGATGVAGNLKNATVNYNIFTVMSKYGGYEGQSTTLKDLYKLCQNIEGVFQQEYKLSNTAMWCNPTSTEFSSPINIGDGFTKVALIKLQAKYLFR